MIDSLWAKSENLPAFPPLDRDISTDVLIIGGGMAGILCAYRLQHAGVDCTLIEADRIMTGVSRNTTAKITSQHGLIYCRLLDRFGADTARSYWELGQQALQQYHDLARSYACDLEVRDSYIYSTDFPDPLTRELTALDRLGIPAEFVSTPGLPFPTVGAIRFRDQAQFHPLKLAAGLCKDLHIREHTAAREFVGTTVLTDHGRITASKIIVATHFPLLNKHGSYFLKLYQQRSYVLALENATAPEGLYLDSAENGLSLRSYGKLLLLGGGGHRTGKKGGGWAQLEEAVQSYFPNAREVCRWAAQDCMTLDGLPYVGQYSKSTPNLYVATGFQKWGMTNAMAAADILCDLVQGKENRYASLLSPSRSMLRPQLLVNGVEAAINLFTPAAPRCPHLGCALKWNPQEHSWDCPCHGSRFSRDGSLLDGPATGPMK